VTAESIAAALGGRRSGRGWSCKCPAHEDANPSLSIAERDGKLLVRCHANCDQAAVIAALKDRGLWPESTWREWRDGIRYPADWGEVVAEYRYSDERGEYLYSVVRFSPKSFRPGYLDGGRWKWGKHPRQVLYRLREVTENPIIFIPEGERDVETLREFGFVATCEAGGAKAPWLDSYTQALRGREVILLPDADTPGRARVKRIARALYKKVARLVVIELENAKDVTEWFRQGHSEVELIQILDPEEISR
jgi:putative DNA primase/helicase